MGRLAFRTACQDDLPAIIALLADDQLGRDRENPGHPLDPGYIAGFEAIAADPNQELVVGELDGHVVASLQLSFIPGLSFHGAWRGQIEAVRIASALRGQGLGGELIAWAVERCRLRGCRMVQLTSSNDRTDSHRFYEKLGFRMSHYGFKMMLPHEEGIQE